MRFSGGVRYQWGLFKRKISSKSLEPFLRYGQKTSKMHQKWGFPPIYDPPRFFFKNRALVTFVPLWCTNFMQKIRRILRAVSEIWTKNIKNAPKMGVFPHLWPPRFFLKNRALSLLYPYGALTSCKTRQSIQWTPGYTF